MGENHLPFLPSTISTSYLHLCFDSCLLLRREELSHFLLRPFSIVSGTPVFSPYPELSVLPYTIKISPLGWVILMKILTCCNLPHHELHIAKSSGEWSAHCHLSARLSLFSFNRVTSRTHHSPGFLHILLAALPQSFC